MSFLAQALRPAARVLNNIRQAQTPRLQTLLYNKRTMATNTNEYKFNHTMLRVKDPKESVKFYEFLGMSLLKKLEFPEAKFDLYFLGYDAPAAPSASASVFDRQGVLELTHNHGTEADATYRVNNGNVEPHRGFGHTCISVDNIQAACARIAGAGYEFQKRLEDGRMRQIAFARDPDGYWVEIIGKRPLEESEGIEQTDVSTYRMNHTMLRAKDPKKSLEFYQSVLGMSLLRTHESAAAGFTLYFLGYPGPAANGAFPADANPAHFEGLLELTWNHGTEKEDDFAYHDGNAEPQGFGHIAITVDNIDAACARFEEMGCRWKKRLTDGRMKNVAFLLDPDGYWVELVQNERFSGKDNF